jgi:hypothetical protein
MPAKSVIRKTIEIDKHIFDLEIYPRLVSWEVFPKTKDAALYAFSNKDTLNKTIETNHIYEKRKK